jgi:hydroxymethylpyrimidine pyrophosphatase-like HAD family hydrolase
MNHSTPILAIDLDGTILHPEPSAIAVWGRTRYQYLSRKSAQLLAEIGQVTPIAIATARHAQTVKLLVEQLPDVNFCGFVLENGLISKQSLAETIDIELDWAPVLQQLPNWERLSGYEQCLGLIPPPALMHPQETLKKILSQLGQELHLYVDGRKLFLYHTYQNKSMGLKALGLANFVAAGNDLNDLEMLNESCYAATVSQAHPKVVDLVKIQGGYCSHLASHAGTEDLLFHILTQFRLQKFTV